MTAIQRVGPRSTGSGAQSTESNALRHFYFIAIAIVVTLLVLRIIVLRRRNQALSDFFRMGSGTPYSYGSYPPHDSNYGSMYHGIQLPHPPATYRPDGRVRAADVDACGRRFDSAGEEYGGKDALPAYDNLDRPPKYVEACGSHGSPPPPTEQPAAAEMPSTEGEQSRMTHQNTANSVLGNDNDTHPMTGTAHGREATAPRTRNTLVGS